MRKIKYISILKKNREEETPGNINMGASRLRMDKQIFTLFRVYSRLHHITSNISLG